MNLTRVLNVALPDMPARVLSERPPRLDPGIIAREHIEDGKPVIRTYVPSAKSMFTFPPQNWKLAQLFDGVRSYEEIAELYSQQTGAQYSAEEMRDFASSLAPQKTKAAKPVGRFFRCAFPCLQSRSLPDKTL